MNEENYTSYVKAVTQKERGLFQVSIDACFALRVIFFLDISITAPIERARFYHRDSYYFGLSEV
jgi:hypothetical protein